MKVIIAGSRTITDYTIVENFINSLNLIITEVISGGARGIDRLGERWAKENNIPIVQFIPDWNKGKSAGYKRNEEMGQYADAAIIFIQNKSKGSTHMKNIMEKLRKKVYLLEI